MGRLVVLSCVVSLAGALALSASGQPTGGKVEKKEPAEVKVFTMKHLDGAEVVAVLQQLFQDRELRIAHHRPSNTVIALGSTEKLRLVETVVSKLDDSSKKIERSEIKIIALKNAQAGDLAATLQQLFQDHVVRINADPRSNALLLSGTADELQAVLAVVQKLDAMTEKQPPAPGNGP